MKNPRPDFLSEIFGSHHSGPWVVGILNVTPDSFSDGGEFLQPTAARRRVISLLREGADAVEIGAESTRPGSEAISAAVQLQRLEPVLSGLRDELRQETGKEPTLILDTRLASVAEAGRSWGITMINDVSAGRFDREMLPWLAHRAMPAILMHSRGTPKDMRDQCDYGQNFLEAVRSECLELLERAEQVGILRRNLILDPGFGFAKTRLQSRTLLSHLDRLADLGVPVMAGVSRKSFLRHSDEESVDLSELDRRTLAASVLAVLRGAKILRLHAVSEMVPVLRMAKTLVIAENSKTKPL